MFFCTLICIGCRPGSANSTFDPGAPRTLGDIAANRASIYHGVFLAKVMQVMIQPGPLPLVTPDYVSNPGHYAEVELVRALIEPTEPIEQPVGRKLEVGERIWVHTDLVAPGYLACQTKRVRSGELLIVFPRQELPTVSTPMGVSSFRGALIHRFLCVAADDQKTVELADHSDYVQSLYDDVDVPLDVFEAGLRLLWRNAEIAAERPSAQIGESCEQLDCDAKGGACFYGAGCTSGQPAETEGQSSGLRPDGT